jgi:hypothetical protein
VLFEDLGQSLFAVGIFLVALCALLWLMTWLDQL